MKLIYTRQVAIIIIRCAVILLFCYTATSKWLSYNDFLYQLKQSPFIHSGYAFLSFAVPLVEIIISIGLMLSATLKIALAGAVLLLFLFTIYITSMLLWAHHVPCSCGGFISSLSWAQHICLNSIMIILCTWAYLMQKGNDKAAAGSV